VRLVGALACGLLITLSLPPLSLWPLAWLGLAGFVLLVMGQRWPWRFAVGVAVGAGQYAVGLWWVNEFQPVGYVALVMVCALYPAVAAAATPARRPLGALLGLPAALTAVEWLRYRWPLGGFPLASVALGQANSPLAALARLGGSLALTAGTALAGAALAAAAVALRARASRVKTAAASASLAAVVLAATLGGTWSPAGGPATGTIRVALVQGGGQRGTRAVYTDPDVVFARQAAASTRLRPPLDLVVWPEGMLQAHIDYRDTNGAHYLSALAQRLHATVVAGVEQDVGATHYLNQAVAWAPDGREVGAYEKNIRVPFGEYVPWRSLIAHFFSLQLVPRDAIAGHGPALLDTPAAPLGIMISYEVFFDRRAQSAVTSGGRLLVVPTNTASYASSQVPDQELAADRLRAWETGRMLVQVTPTGYTDVVGVRGQVLRRSGLGSPDVIVATVQLRRGETVFDRVGEWPVEVAALVVLALAWVLVGASGRRRRQAVPAGTAPRPSPEVKSGSI
jgi:apolipoprotein N-acyltransferase